MKLRIRAYAHLRHGEPLPDEAKLVSKFEGQGHSRYGVLIELPPETQEVRG